MVAVVVVVDVKVLGVKLDDDVGDVNVAVDGK